MTVSGAGSDSDDQLGQRVAAAEQSGGDRLERLEDLVTDVRAALNERESTPTGQ